MDLALLGAAWMIASQSGTPMSTTAVLAIVACVITGTIVALVPLILRYERQKNEVLDDRQRAIEALAQTVSASAEQISIATSGLHEIAELAHKNLKQAEQLSHRLQEKISEFQGQLANADVAEKEELEKELAALRSAETERLESACDKVARTVAELAKLEAATRQHLSGATEALNKLALGTANAIGKAQAAAEQALTQARVEAARHVGENAGTGIRNLESAKAAALAEIEAKLSAAGAAVAERIARDATAKISAILATAGDRTVRWENPGPAAPAAGPAAAIESPATGHHREGAAPSAAAPAAAPEPAAPAEAAGPAKRTRKPRREEPSPEVTAAAPIEPPPVPVESIPEVTPVAPGTTEPFNRHGSGHAHAGPNGEPTPVSTAAPAAVAVESSPPAADTAAKPASSHKKRAAKPAAVETEDLGLGIDDGLPAAGVVERVLSSDGATRLVVTAYIGIGNRLFIRGQGPGLSWDKGVPLQFVSIGKWRWETNDATQPVRFKLLKNDEQECAALGAQALDPGHQQEVTATF